MISKFGASYWFPGHGHMFFFFETRSWAQVKRENSSLVIGRRLGPGGLVLGRHARVEATPQNSLPSPFSLRKKTPNPTNPSRPTAAAAAAMNPACAEAAAAKKSRHKDKKEKKSKRKETAEHLGGEPATAEEEAVHKKKKKKHAKEEGKADPKRRPTVSIAVAGSVIDNAQSLELATLVSNPVPYRLPCTLHFLH